MSRISTASIKDTPTRLAIQKLADKLDEDKAPTFAGMNFTGKVTAGSWGSPIDVTSTRKYGFELHYSGNDYDVFGLRSRASLITTTAPTRTATGAELQAANTDGISAAVLCGAKLSSTGKSTATSATISYMRAVDLITEWGAKDTITNLLNTHIKCITRNAAGEGSFGTGYGIYLENIAVGGTGQALDAGIYFKDTDISGGNKAFTYGIDFSGGTFATAEIRFSNGETIDNLTDGQLDITGDLAISGTLIGYLKADGSVDLTDNWTIATKNITLTAGTLTAEQITSTDDITMEGHLLTMGDAGAATDTILSFLGLTNSGSITFRQDVNQFTFGAAKIFTTNYVIANELHGNRLVIGTDAGEADEINVVVTGKASYRLKTTTTNNFTQNAIQAGTNSFYYYTFGQDYSTSGRYEASSSLLDAAGAGGLGISAYHADGVIKFWTAGNNLRGVIDNSGIWKLGDGGTTNYTQFAADGLQTMAGTARVYKEITIGASTAHKGSSSPDDVYLAGGSHVLAFDKTTTQHVHYTTIIPQDFAAGTEIAVDVDWSFDTVEAGHYMTWELEYLLVADGEDPAGALTSTSQKSVISTGNNDKQIHTVFATGITGAVADDTLMLRFSRDADHVTDDDLNQDANLLAIHLHYVSDKLGEAT